ncbi:MAG: hypothetical protein OHK0039_39120 [Bacteroidia bacterium]
MSERLRLPFTIENLYNGLAQVDGILLTSRDSITLEFQVKDSFIGRIKSGPKALHLPLKEIESVRFRKGWFDASFYIRVFRMAAIKDMPSSQSGEIRLKVKRGDRETALRVESQIALRLSELRIDALDEDQDF